MRRRRLTVYGLGASAALVVLVVVLSTASRSTPAPFGIATAGGNQGASELVATCAVPHAPCPAGRLRLVPPFAGRSHGAAAFVALRDQLLKPGAYMRLWIPYDALYTWDSGRGDCGWSRYAFGAPARFNALNGMEVFDRLVWDIQGARALRLSPEVVFSAGSGEGAPAYPDPGYGDGTHPFAGVTPAGRDYYCGVLGVIGWLRAKLGTEAPTHWEAFNEPDRYPPYFGDLRHICGRPYADCGALEAAELWELAQSAADRLGGGHVAALSVTDPQSGYAADYISQLDSPSACAVGLEPFPIICAFPRYWAVHDYDDPTAGGTADLQAFERTLSSAATRTDPPLDVWVTESAVEPGSQTRADRNRVGCPGPEPDNADTLGACVDNNPEAQQRGAQAWRSLIDVSAPGVRTTQVYWFEFQLIKGWDSALVDANGRPRPAFCGLVPGTACRGDPSDYLLDWQTIPTERFSRLTREPPYRL